MLEILGSDISELGDSDLRALIGLLCETELRNNGLPTVGVTWGGHQDAADGGVDVRVELTNTQIPGNYIPRGMTCFQVKKSDMPRSEIINEMRPKGELRQVIKDLIEMGGAYIIVSSQGSTTDSALLDRKAAMSAAISDYQNAEKLKVDFYDRERIAGWVRCHPALILWVRDKLGKSLAGWRTYANWANCPGGLKEEYMLDEHVRLHNGSDPSSDGLSALEGINNLRLILQRPRTSVRLVGLSGVGKTRLIQALFDERIGEKALDQSQVFYTDMSDSPIPDPRNFSERIIASRTPSCLVIDNCPPELHNRLTTICSATGSLVSLLTVEYDVRDDQPEETTVYRLEPASSELIEKVLRIRFNQLSAVNARTIAKVSGGNARIAIAIARTVQQGEDLANLRNNQIFIRLFEQRNASNNDLLRVAEVCSLVYSFDGRAVDSDESELRVLSSLIDVPTIDMYRHISELKRRELVQQRGEWRAVLPHAIANKLAQRALESIPIDILLNVLQSEGSERLLKSFSRRLSYLHESKEANEIIRSWFSEKGLLGDISNLNELGISLFTNTAPINPELTLSAMEKILGSDAEQHFFSKNNVRSIFFTNLLRSIAYDQNLFDRSVHLLCLFALTEDSNERNNSIRSLLKSLFYLYLSGTHATPEQRLRLIVCLIESKSEDRINLGMSLLSAALEAGHFSSHHNFEFGARPRDYGYSPRSREGIRAWYKAFIEYALSLATSEIKVSTQAKDLLAENFRMLWTKAGMYDELEATVIKLAKNGAWSEGWIAVCTIRRYDKERMDSDIYDRLNKLDVMLNPTTLLERSKLYALSRFTPFITSDEDSDKEDVKTTTRLLGKEVASKDGVFRELLLDILSNDGLRLYYFGQGLAEGCSNFEKMWRKFHEQLSLIEGQQRNFRVLCGFLDRVSTLNPDLAETFLNESVSDDIFAPVFPLLQSNIKPSNQGIERIKRSLDLGKTKISHYVSLVSGVFIQTIDDSDLCKLLRMIASKPEGVEVATQILYLRIRRGYDDEVVNQAIVSIGQELVTQFPFTRSSHHHNCDYELAQIIKICFATDLAQENTRILCSRIVDAYINNNIYSMDFPEVLEQLTKVQPLVFLDTFLGDRAELDYMLQEVLFSEFTPNPVSYIDDDLVITWCERNPKTRYPLIASAIIPYKLDKKMEWTSLALKIIANSSDPVVVLDKFRSAFRLRSSNGSRADEMQIRLNLITDLKEHENTLISDWAIVIEKELKAEIRSEREYESKQESVRNERFE